MTGKHAIRAALCAAILVAGAGSARGLELKDLIIQFDGIDQVVTSFRHEPSRFPRTIDAIAGKLVWYGSSENCLSKVQSLVYQPGTLTGTADCPMERRGTAKNWDERGGTATYTTSMAVAGSVVTLQGKMTGRGTLVSNHCGDRNTTEKHFEVTQALKIRITGNTCQVLQYSQTSVTTERYTYRSDGAELSTSVSTTTSRLAPNAKCTIRRRSDEPVRPPGGLVSATRNC